jgi:CPA1 family monovalent cation:H+ antiporter
VLTPFVAYISAERLQVSGVLATVVAGLVVGARSLDIIEPDTRLRTLAFWESVGFLLDGLLFLLIGVQVPSILGRIENADPLKLSAYALLISGVVLGVRMLWMVVLPAVVPSETTRSERIVIAWSGMRGGVSLAAALAIPVKDFPDRDLVLFVAYAAIVLTLVVPGLTLAPLVQRLGLQHEPELDAEARLRITKAALEKLDELAEEAPDHVVDQLRTRYDSRVDRLEARLQGDEDEDGRSDAAMTGRLLAEMIEAERDVLRAMRGERAFPTEVLREIERELDLDESRLRARIRL